MKVGERVWTTGTFVNSDGSRTTLGTGCGVLGAFMVAYAMVRLRRVTAALDANGPVVPDWWAVTLVTAISLALAVGTIVTVLFAA